MFIAHLPAGYLFTRALQKRFKTTPYLWIGLVASVLPDIDLFYFYFVDHRQTLHHEYWTHLPLFWLVLWVAALLVGWITKRQNIHLISTIIFLNIFLHLILDTFIGGISWISPFGHTSYHLLTVTARHSWWISNFIFHWTFLIEIAIVVWAFVVFIKDQKSDVFIFNRTD